MSYNNIDHRNFETVITGKVIIENDGPLITYKLIDAMIWWPKSQKWHSLSYDPDKFQTTAENFETARSEFWFHWHLYIQKRFNRNYIKLELTHI